MNELRKQVDLIDSEILRLLSKRKELAREIGKIKKERDLPIHDKERESRIIEKLKQKARENELDEDSIKDLWEVIFKYSRQEQWKSE